MGWALTAQSVGWTPGWLLAEVPRSAVALFTETEDLEEGMLG